MFHKEKKSYVNFDYNIDKVYNAILQAADSISKFRVTNKNKVTHCITIDISMSLFSWVEQMTVSLNNIGENKTEVYFSSGGKLGTELVTNIKNQKNIDELMNTMSTYLL